MSAVPGPPLEADELAALPAALDALGSRRVLVVTGPSERYLDRVKPLLGERAVGVYSGARRHVPEDVVAEATQALAASGADTVIALGGGSAIGLAKVLGLEHAITLVAIPTTYSGSEHTNIHGRLENGKKVTGRDDRVRPRLVIHDVELTLDMPKALSVTSLLNALAHPLGTLLTTADGEQRSEQALAAIERVYGAIDGILRSPVDPGARAAALRGAAQAARLLEGAKVGAHHELVHRLGGMLDLEHGALHAALLPHTVHAARATHAPVVREVEARLAVGDLEAGLFDALVRAGAPTSLKALGVTLAKLDAILLSHAELPRALLRSAYHGRRPSRATRHEDFGLSEPVAVHGPAPATARRVIVALHGRGATADGAVARVLELTGDDPELAILAPQATDNAWYTGRYSAPKRELAELEGALAATGKVLDHAVSEAGAEHVALYGFSQGACLALELSSRRSERLAGVVALSGANIGAPGEELAPPSALRGMPVLVGASRGDPWLGEGDVERTAKHLATAGLDVTLAMAAGEAHTLHAEHRLLAHAALAGRAPPPAPLGFGNHHASEALPGALPAAQNTPRHAPYGLYPEQLNGTGFTARRAENARVWMYRVRPSTNASPFVPLDGALFSDDFCAEPLEANLTGFAPLAPPVTPTDFVAGVRTIGGSGSAAARRGFAVHVYAANRSMEERAVCNADGDLLLLPQQGRLTLLTELGALEVRPGELALVPRGIRFSVLLRDATARGYLAEVYGRHFGLPERGLIGANGLADPRHFRGPAAWFENRLSPGFRLTHKLGGKLYEARQDHSPFDVVAWHGNYTPVVYDLSLFSPVGNARVDHVDPSVHTVLSAPLDEPGTASLDLVVFAPRWDATEGTFRPPYFHRNGTTEINGIVRDITTRETFFAPGALFITPGMTPHGPGAALTRRILAQSPKVADRPHRYSDQALWFQFETTLPLSLSRWAKSAPERVADFGGVWGVHRPRFAPT